MKALLILEAVRRLQDLLEETSGDAEPLIEIRVTQKTYRDLRHMLLFQCPPPAIMQAQETIQEPSVKIAGVRIVE
jgi:hypothetical protein